MKILHALGWYFPETLGGTEIYVKALAERQRALEHQVEVAAPSPGSTRAELSEYEGIPVLRYPTPSEPTRDEAQGRIAARGSEVFRDHLDTWRPDILHVHTFTTGLGIHELERAKELGIKTVATNHLGSVGFVCQRGTLMRWGEYACDGLAEDLKCAACELQNRGLPKGIAWSASYVGRVLGSLGAKLPGKLGTALGMSDLIAHNRKRQQRVLDVLDRFVLLSRAASDVVVKNGGDPKKLALNYLGLSHQHYQPKPRPEEQPTTAPVTFGYLGRFATLKGILDLARALASLPADVPLRAEFRGPTVDDGSASIRRQIDAIGGGDRRVRFGPVAPPEQVPTVLAGYDALCVPSVTFEGGPTVVSEAHAVGTPVIGTRIGAMPEIIDDGVNGALVEPGDWQALAAVLADVANRPGLTIDAWRRALPKPRTMDDVAADYETLYEEIAR